MPADVREVMREFFSSYPPGVLVPHDYLPDDLQVPRVEERLGRATKELRRAIGLCLVQPRTCWMDKLFSKLDVLCGLEPRSHTPFYCYVAGGFVVAEMLGYGDWTDIDVWTRPFPVGQPPSGYLVAAGKGAYPVNVLATSCMESTIESFDLHICSCAILCCILDQKIWAYDFHMTKNCAFAFKRRSAHACALHPAVAQPTRLAERLAKYSARGLEICRDTMESMKTAVERDTHGVPLEVVLQDWHLDQNDVGFGCGHWEVTILDRRIVGIALRAGASTPTAPQVPASRPVVLYPCRKQRQGEQRVGLPETASWIFSAMAGNDAIVAVRGGTRLQASALVPDWFMPYLHGVRQEEIILLLKAAFVSSSPDLADATVTIPCAYPLKLVAQLYDWKCTDKEGGDLYTPSWLLVLDPGSADVLPSALYCADTMHVGGSCSVKRKAYRVTPGQRGFLAREDSA